MLEQQDVDQSASRSAELVLMGTGTSVGVPVVGCDCAVCRSNDPRNQRLRSGVLVRAPLGEFVVDTGPEFRLQLLRNQATFIQAALFTHAHADHIMGLDDLRIFGFRKERMALRAAEEQALDAGVSFDSGAALKSNPGNIPLYCEEEVEAGIRQVFHYAFTDPDSHSHRFAAPRLGFERIQPGTSLNVLGQDVLPIRLHHGKLPVLGFRFGNVAFCTDVSTIPAASRSLLEGLDVLVIDALRYDPHPTHLSVSQAVKWAQKLNAKQTYLTHMSHDLDYHQLVDDLPEGISPAYDGLTIPIAPASKTSSAEIG